MVKLFDILRDFLTHIDIDIDTCVFLLVTPTWLSLGRQSLS